MAIKRVYKSTLGASQYLFANGKSAHFVNGRFETDVPAEILELDEQINKFAIQHIYVDPADATRDTGKEDYIRERQKQATIEAMKEYEEKQAGKLPETSPPVADPQTGEVAKLQEKQEPEKTTPPSNLATLLAARTNQVTQVTQPPSTGIANSDNAPKA